MLSTEVCCSADSLSRYLTLHPERVGGDATHRRPIAHDIIILLTMTAMHNEGCSTGGNVNSSLLQQLLVTAVERHGASLDAIDPITGNTVLHTLAASPGQRTVDGESQDVVDYGAILRYILQNPTRPSLHTKNVLGLTAVEQAVRVGNVALVDAMVAETLTEAAHGNVASSALQASCDSSASGIDRCLSGLPIAFVMGAEWISNPEAGWTVQDTTSSSQPSESTGMAMIALRFRRLAMLAAQCGQAVMLRYLMQLKLPFGLLQRLALFPCASLLHVPAYARRASSLKSWTAAIPPSAVAASPFDRCYVFDTLPVRDNSWDDAETVSLLFQQYGTPLHICCQYVSSPPSIEASLDVLLEVAATRHVTQDEVRQQEARAAEPYHDHIPPVVPAAVYSLLRYRDANGRCSLHYAADGKHDGTIATMEWLLSHDPSLLALVDAGGRTALQSALRSKRNANAQWLLSAFGSKPMGADARISRIVSTPSPPLVTLSRLV